jgi:hypothetical protein
MTLVKSLYSGDPDADLQVPNIQGASLVSTIRVKAIACLS